MEWIRALVLIWLLGVPPAAFAINDMTKEPGTRAAIGASIVAGSAWPAIIFWRYVNSEIGKAR